MTSFDPAPDGLPPAEAVPDDRPPDWRVEADDAWLAAHRSDNFERMRRRLKRWGMLADAVSQAELGPYGGAPRKPDLKLGGRSYAVVRYVTQRIAYTAIQVDLHQCRRCGRRLVEVHRIRRIREDGAAESVGALWMCRHCQARAWLFHSEMPRVVRARRRDRRVVL